MKYFTKEWYSLPTDRTICMKPCEDRPYSEEEIQKLYQKELKKFVREEKKTYNEPPFFLPIDFDEIGLDDILFIDEETGEDRHPTSIEEAKEAFALEQKQAMEEFKNRPPFDETGAIACFQEFYESKKENCPKGLQAELYALDLLPKSLYDEWKKQDKENQKKRDAIEKAYEKDTSVMPLWDYSFHDGTILSFEDGVLIIETEEKQTVKLRFEDYEITENEVKEGDWVLYEETYNLGGLYEIHFLTSGEELHYLTVRAKSVEFSD